MGSVTGWAWRAAGSGCTAASGPRASRGGTVCGSPPPPPPSTRAPGPTGSRTGTAQRRTLTEVRSKIFYFFVVGESIEVQMAMSPARPSNLIFYAVDNLNTTAIPWFLETGGLQAAASPQELFFSRHRPLSE